MSSTVCACCKQGGSETCIRELDKCSAIDFEPITPRFIIKNREVLKASSIKLCDLTPGCLYMWRDFYSMKAAIVHDMLVCIAGDAEEHGEDGNLYYTCPIGGGDFGAAVRACKRDADARGIVFRMCTVPDEAIAPIESAIGRKASVESDIDRPDFLYHYENFLGYSGKALHAHRNHINRFIRENPEYRFEPLTLENRDAALKFLREHHAELEKGNAVSDEDLMRTEELLNCFDLLDLSGGILYAGERAVGFTLGETIADTLHVHVEKADHSVHGAFQMLAMSFAEYMKRDGLKFINRQDDAEDEGLYRSKMSYRPCALLNKNVLTF
ncbi:MAG: DUF2156 domain-containing protein [Clostridia bacterium]|nr:DUF2156 domain-containing protein [Clostridia bacterium]